MLLIYVTYNITLILLKQSERVQTSEILNRKKKIYHILLLESYVYVFIYEYALID